MEYVPGSKPTKVKDFFEGIEFVLKPWPSLHTLPTKNVN